jgi:hypothetical protein
MGAYANEHYIPRSYALAKTGLWPHEVSIPTGTRLYRFVDFAKGPAAADGSWWFEYEHYQSIMMFAQRNGHPVGYTARLFAAILYEWGEVNAVVCAEVVKGPLMAWKGEGKVVTPCKNDQRDVASVHGILTEWNGSGEPVQDSRRMIPMQGPARVLQLFIPGLGHPHYHLSDFMTVVRHVPISS